ncbi:hypothetical protein BRADI_4g14105v3 [Brachypodium distachyon]|uniref:NB-ARC domain-containing protein n=1 Tax=Brachypodium distachyon TaxID=15368 RepID=A0A2K2CMR2_BRADI|nr:hypothetical protein BRADI_4g14105v3 [Brachypodium distachyon]
MLYVYWLAESHLRYKHLLQDDDGDGNSRTSSSYTAERGDTFLVGIQAALRNKQLRWFMVANRKADMKPDMKTDLKVISMVGPAGVGKAALAMEIYRQLQQNEARNYFQCCATVKVSRKPDIKELLKHILLQIDEPAALASEAVAEGSQITTLEDGIPPSRFPVNMKLAHDINQCLQEKRPRRHGEHHAMSFVAIMESRQRWLRRWRRRRTR